MSDMDAVQFHPAVILGRRFSILRRWIRRDAASGRSCEFLRLQLRGRLILPLVVVLMCISGCGREEPAEPPTVSDAVTPPEASDQDMLAEGDRHVQRLDRSVESSPDTRGWVCRGGL